MKKRLLTREEIRKLVLAAAPDAEKAELDDDAPLLRSSIIDSVSVFQLVLRIEEKSGVRVRSHEIRPENFGTIAAIERFLRAKLKTVLPFLLLAALGASGAAAPRLYWFIPDGLRADPETFDLFSRARDGRYPNIRRMMEMGSFGYSIPVYPTITPVNFATLVTGAYPERHGVADGVMYEDGMRLGGPSVRGFSSASKRVEPFWKSLEERGFKVALVSMPGSAPPELRRGATIRARWGLWGDDFQALTFETPASPRERAARGRSVRLFYAGQELTKFVPAEEPSGWPRAPVSFSPPRELGLLAYGTTVYAYLHDSTDDGLENYDSAAFAADKREIAAVLRGPGQWSGWTPVTLQGASGPVATRMRIGLVRIGPPAYARIRLLFDVLNPTVASPGELADQIRARVGPMVDFPDNWPGQLNEHPEDKEIFLAEARWALDWHRRLVPHLVDQVKPDAVLHDIYVPNQMLESRWWLPRLDPASAAFGAASPTERAALQDEVDEMYRGIDAILGEAMAGTPDGLVVLSSDHGVIALNKQVHVNNELKRRGFLRFEIDPATGEPVVDWARSRAVHLKMHGVYLHPEGLGGSWSRASGPGYLKLRAEVAAVLRELKDEGVNVIEKIVARENAAELRLPPDRVADLILVMRPGYGLTEEMTSDGALLSAPKAGGYKQAVLAAGTPGLWTPFMIAGPGIRKNHRLERPIEHVDQLPTILKALGLEVPAHVQGRAIDAVFER